MKKRRRRPGGECKSCHKRYPAGRIGGLCSRKELRIGGRWRCNGLIVTERITESTCVDCGRDFNPSEETLVPISTLCDQCARARAAFVDGLGASDDG